MLNFAWASERLGLAALVLIYVLSISPADASQQIDLVPVPQFAKGPR